MRSKYQENSLVMGLLFFNAMKFMLSGEKSCLIHSTYSAFYFQGELLNPQNMTF